MPFGFKNVPPTYQRTMSMAFCEYLGVFSDDFSVFSDFKKTLPNFSCVLTNANNLAEKVHVLVFLTWVCWLQVGKVLDLKKNLAIVNMPTF
jgi:hypothetical protein